MVVLGIALIIETIIGALIIIYVEMNKKDIEKMQKEEKDEMQDLKHIIERELATKKIRINKSYNERLC